MHLKMQYDASIQINVGSGCNLNCEYCMLRAMRRARWLPELAASIRDRINDFFFRSSAARKPDLLGQGLDADRFLRTLEKTGKTFLITFSGGEPFLTKGIAETCARLSERHYLGFTTNLTPTAVKDFIRIVSPSRVRFIVASAHVAECRRRGLLETYVENFLACREKGFSIVADVVAYPGYFEGLPEYRQYFLKHGIQIQLSPYKGIYRGRRYPESYTQQEREMLIPGMIDSFYTRGKLCNAGYNIMISNCHGQVQPCYVINRTMGHIYEKITLERKLMKCPFDFCGCPFWHYYSDLFQQALEQTGHRDRLPDSVTPAVKTEISDHTAI
jgi:MoaA/NifB/PqqE/SkfB family radical SAM enzyme